MRLDLVLKLSGLIKRRTIAKTLCENGKIMINSKISKPSSEVKDGDKLTLCLGEKVIEVTIGFEQKYKKEFPYYREDEKLHVKN